MKTNTLQNLTLYFMVACSLFGSSTILLMMIYPPAAVQDYLWRKPLVGSIFFLMCVGGSLAAVSPRSCLIAHETRIVKSSISSSVKPNFPVSSEGHHPDCGRFSAHTIRFRGASHCAACTGLLVGGVTATIVAVLYFFFRLNTGSASYPETLMGELGLASGLVQFKLRSWTRSAANLLFALGGSLMLVGVDQLFGSVFIDIYAVGLILLWILTRVMLSQWDHRGICLRCGLSCGTENAREL